MTCVISLLLELPKIRIRFYFKIEKCVVVAESDSV
jgi:hypothetical protein